MKKTLLSIFLTLLSFQLFSQTPALSSTEIYLGIQKLATVGNVMYVAAHPDDENTLLITYLSKDRNVRTAYFAMTRGDGGQNLVGPEQGEYVGLLRTHELLEARKIDGGEQYFSRAIDFGFSKSTDEALLFWGKEQILEDLVYRIRKFKPDVIINRFPPDERAGHGHHSASAVLSKEAFDAAADATKYSHQLKEVEPWQSKRLVWNTFGRNFSNEAPQDGSYVEIPLGDFNPLLGESYSEMAARARSKHRSQGFGSAPTRGERVDFLVHIKGEPAKKDIFDGIDLSWKRVKGGEKIDQQLKQLLANYNFKNPSASLSDLLKVYKAIEVLDDKVYKAKKLEECKQLILAVTGTYLELNTTASSATPGQALKLLGTVTQRTGQSVKLESLSLRGAINKDTLIQKSISTNRNLDLAWDVQLPNNASITQPYWLVQGKGLGTYKLEDEKWRNLPMAPDALEVTFKLQVEGQALEVTYPVKYKYVEPSRGEIYKYFEIRPAVTVNFAQNVIVFKGTEAKQVGLMVKNHTAGAHTVKVSLNVPQGWKVSPVSINVPFTTKDQEKAIQFEVTPAANGSVNALEAVVEAKGEKLNYGHKTISYEHIPELNVFPKAEAKAIYLDVKIDKRNIGYIMGAGDEVPLALREMGYQLSFIDENSIKGNLSQYDAIVIGVRAYNTLDWLANSQNIILDYVKAGGNVVVQYQTQAFYGTIKTNEMGPYPLSIGRGRVTNEDAEVKFVNAADPILNYPNKITSKDFEGWVQERGLYFAQQWSDKYTTVLKMKDQGETEQEGSLLYTTYGKGKFVFTGLALFRQLPAGVPGAYRLMANLISLK